MPQRKIVNFKLVSGLQNKEQQDILAAVGRISGVFNVRALFPEAKSGNSRRMYYATLEPGADADAVARQAAAIRGIEYASKPAPRRLM